MRFTNKNSNNKHFGGKIVVLGGDFRQILPVMPKGRREDIVHATINASYLWDHCHVLTLTKNMRLQTGRSAAEVDELKKFSEWILSIGDGNAGKQVEDETILDIPHDLLIPHSGDAMASIVNSTYPSFLQDYENPKFFQDCAILSPTNEIVDSLNEYMMSLLPRDEKTYLSADNTCSSDINYDSQDDTHTPEFLNTINSSGLPNHLLKLKKGALVMLLRNIDQSAGLCNGTRLIITEMGKYVLEGKVISKTNAGKRVATPRLTLTPSDRRIPFKFQRRQFPIALSFAMTINKSQGQSLKSVGLYLPKPVFSHGQLYVAFSRVTHRKGLKILICDGDDSNSNSTSNVVYKEVFRNLV
ncbi:uncharacterized protein LOC130730349 [Lotus japonicus]|uniref:uncharacterized protein LOC130730349 n=1 Tax=Lotus japonicus TaxID=34305 RepID=UPI002584130A|nr:uncharacterized protein LOC130730349 [Lotus japonicus]